MLAISIFTFMEVKSFFVPCPFKWLTRLDCPGCGFQRSVWAFVRGDFEGSFTFYPPLLLFLLSFFAASLSYVFKWNSESKVLKTLYIGTGILVVANYVYKIITHQLH